jgi:hypothetical protein
VSPAPKIKLSRKAYDLVGVQGKDYYEVLLPSEQTADNDDEETRQFLEHLAAQNAPDPWDCVGECESISILHDSQDGSVNLLSDDHEEKKEETAIVDLANPVTLLTKNPDPGYPLDPGPQVAVFCPHCLECPFQNS